MPHARRIAIVGAGPIGLEAALFARQSGFDVTVFERGTIAANVQAWGHVRLFSPFSLNASPWGCEALKQHGHPLPGDEELLTGRAFAERYLVPLSQLPELDGCIREQTQVRSIGRAGQLKHQHIGKPARQQTPFRLLLSHQQGEQIEQGDYVLDCSGTYPHHNWLGDGGMPCLGERNGLTQKSYELPDILGKDRERFANGLTLIVGSGYSAATAIVALGELAKTHPQTKAIWLTRSESELPITPIPEDSLPERKRLTTLANQLALSDEGPIEWWQGRVVHSIFHGADHRWHITITNHSDQSVRVVANEVLALVGYRPDRALYEELQVHECYASQGPMKLAAALIGDTSTDCLAQTGHGRETLKNPEPGFFILGAKSYGRNPRYLIKLA
ncbi:MAG: NAD(P)-binding domain-containing protein, partial [Planctomycetaceae bacterium]|nr:NAD(P)-binding domain-containing protein [Planctomycetaceae bacterium]